MAEQPAAMQTPRSEYPRPQMVRPDWLCLNGTWQFEIDAGDSGLERGLLERELAHRITVPFCPESPLSGVGNPDFMPAVWYRRTVDVPRSFAGRRTLLHFQAVDYDATVWAGIEGGPMREVVRHRGGFTPFTADLSVALAEHAHHPADLAGKRVTIVLRARDSAAALQPRGKQSRQYHNHACHYTRTTGIWQTVWLEAVPTPALQRPRITPDVGNGLLRLVQPIEAGGPGPHRPGLVLRATLTASLDDQTPVAGAQTAVHDFSPTLDLPVPQQHRRLWSVDDPHLYGLKIELLDADGKVIDAVESYAGLRSVRLEGQRFLVNGACVFQRQVLDQGYYPDGIMTAPTDEALRRDVELTLQMGFNTARLHQKVFEERYLYWADRLGLMCWGEFGDWGCDAYDQTDGHAANNKLPGPDYICQWLEALHRDFCHPCIIGWCGLNETMQAISDRYQQLDDVTRAMFLAAKAMDPTRPVLDASGYSHRVAETDVWDSHDYEQDPGQLAAHHSGTAEGRPFLNRQQQRVVSLAYRGQPVFLSEFGGIRWNPTARRDEARKGSWGYGKDPESEADFIARFQGQCSALLNNAGLFGYCYTQLTDVFQEENGLYTFDRRAKFDPNLIRQIQTAPAAIETHAAP